MCDHSPLFCVCQVAALEQDERRKEREQICRFILGRAEHVQSLAAALELRELVVRIGRGDA